MIRRRESARRLANTNESSESGASRRIGTRWPSVCRISMEQSGRFVRAPGGSDESNAAARPAPSQENLITYYLA